MKKLAFCSAILATTLFLSTPSYSNDIYEYATGQTNVDKLHILSPIGSPFTQALAVEYKNLATFEHNNMIDHSDANLFALKGIAAANGKNILPETIDNWKVPQQNIAALTQARARLMLALNTGARERAPIEAAKAQASYDCWIEEQEENFQDNQIASCKRNFDLVIKALETKVSSITAGLQKATPVQTQKDNSGFTPKYRIFFDLNKTSLNIQSNEIIQIVAHKLKALPDLKAEIIGYTDRSGSIAYNKKLAKKRAESVKTALLKHGVSATQIITISRGEENNFVSTQDGKTESGNRRVEIILK